MRRRLCIGTLVVFGLGALGCSSSTFNVRAYRAYMTEEPSIRVAFDRIEDMAACLELVDRVLNGQSYTPGDIWPKRIALADREATAIRNELKEKYPYSDGEFQVPLLKVYREHISRVLREHAPPPERGMYPSLMDAVAGLNSRPTALKEHWGAYQAATKSLSAATERFEKAKAALEARRAQGKAQPKDPEFEAAEKTLAEARKKADASKSAVEREARNLAADAKLDSKDKQQIARDAFSVLSVVLRLDMETLALIPIITVQMARGIPKVVDDAKRKLDGKIGKQMWELPAYVVGIKEHMSRQMGAIEIMTSELAKLLSTSVSKSPGFELGETIVDQIAGLAWDSFRVDLKAGAESYMYTAIDTGDRGGTDTVKYDYRGRKYKLDYRVEPIVLASANLALAFDWIRMPGVVDLGFGYKTDRMYRSGGSIENTSLSSALGIDGVASDVIDAGLGLLGVRTSARIATFNAGEVRKVRATDVSTAVDTAPLKLKQTQIDVSYDLLWAVGTPTMKAYMEELLVGVRYFDYTLPRIVYQLQDVSTEPGVTKYAFADPSTRSYVGRESPPQSVASQYGMIGGQARFGLGEGPRWSPWLDVGAYGGFGPTKFYFLKDPNGKDVESNRDWMREYAFALNAHLGLGLRWRLLPRGSRLRLDLRALYQADFVYTVITSSTSSDGRSRAVDFGSIDLFHGPTVQIRGAL